MNIRFPIGTLALSAEELSKMLNMTGFKVISVILTILLLVSWLLLMPLTIWNSIITSSWFVSPCLNDYKNNKNNEAYNAQESSQSDLPTLSEIHFNSRKY